MILQICYKFRTATDRNIQYVKERLIYNIHYISHSAIVIIARLNVQIASHIEHHNIYLQM